MNKTVYDTVDDKFFADIKSAIKDFFPKNTNEMFEQIEERIQEDLEEYLEESEKEFMVYNYTVFKSPSSYRIYSFSKYLKTETPDEGVGYDIVEIKTTPTGYKLEIY